jgi:DNA-binding GntR family transcriptional regulator
MSIAALLRRSVLHQAFHVLLARRKKNPITAALQRQLQHLAIPIVVSWTPQSVLPLRQINKSVQLPPLIIGTQRKQVPLL